MIHKATFRLMMAFVVVSMSLPSIVAAGTVMDPCGMVPPIYTGPGAPITRIGLQQTYVFHSGDVETFVIRPGFSGKVDNFGMLIPFPNPPAVRKVADNVFEQIAAAVDPPEVVVNLNMRRFRGLAAGGAPQAAQAMQFSRKGKDKVVVLKQEAVGMYEVAVLQAGSPEALKRWMEQNKYKYPEGMDKVTLEYIKMDWCFVAVKTKVGNKGAVNPVPGQRKVNPKLPKGSVFDGSVQGMGFRFKSEELVVPMRLSAFNKGELRNVVYLLTDDPKKIRSIPEEYVVRQVRGEELIKNLTEPLPVRVIGGTFDDIPDYRKKTLKQERDPAPHNAVARMLFSSDLLAVKSGELSLTHEETEKELLRIGEHFGLRGAKFDLDIASATKKEADKSTKTSLKRLSKMTLTVVDGDFPRDVLANENLKFEKFQMAENRNKREAYDTMLHKAPPEKQGRLYSHMELKKLIEMDRQNAQLKQPSDQRFAYVGVAALLVGIGCWTTSARNRNAKSLSSSTQESE